MEKTAENPISAPASSDATFVQTRSLGMTVGWAVALPLLTPVFWVLGTLTAHLAEASKCELLWPVSVALYLAAIGALIISVILLVRAFILFGYKIDNIEAAAMMTARNTAPRGD